MTHLQFKRGFDPAKVIWSRPESRILPLCSYADCLKRIPEDSVPLMMWNNQGGCVQFCDECVAKFDVGEVS